MEALILSFLAYISLATDTSSFFAISELNVSAEVYHIGTAPEHTCPLNILREQLRAMKAYLDILDKRAIIEGIAIE